MKKMSRISLKSGLRAGGAERGTTVVEYVVILGILVFSGASFLTPFSHRLECKFLSATNQVAGGGTEYDTGDGETCELPAAVLGDPSWDDPGD